MGCNKTRALSQNRMQKLASGSLRHKQAGGTRNHVTADNDQKAAMLTSIRHEHLVKVTPRGPRALQARLTGGMDNLVDHFDTFLKARIALEFN
jgi:hypothetical protein